MNKYKRFIIPLMFSPLLLSGCWDSLEIEEKGFVSAIAIDLANSESKFQMTTPNLQNQLTQEPNQELQQQGNETQLQRDERIFNLNKDEDYGQNENNKFKLTQQLVVPPGLGSSQNSGSNIRPAFQNFSETGDTVIEMNRDMIKRAGRITNVTHLNVVLFSEAVAQEEHLFAELMDIFLREKEMLRSVKVAIVKDHAGDFLNIVPENEKIPGQYISKLLENKSNLEIATPITTGDLQGLLLSKKSFAIPLLNIVDATSLNYLGLSIYNGTEKKVVGILNGDNAKGLNFIHTKDQTGTLNLKLNDNDITLEILEVSSKISLKNADKNNLKFNVSINAEAGIAEQHGSLDMLKQQNYDDLKKALEKKIKEITTNTVSFLQNEVETDLLGLNTHLYKYHYPFWTSIKDDWEDGELYFSQSTVNIDVNVNIEKPGNIIKSN